MSEIPYGYCRCGCGHKTTVSEQNYAKRGWVKGEPKPYILGHATRGKNLHTHSSRNQDGYCLCGCGKKTEIAKVTRADRGYVKGQPKSYVRGHATQGRDLNSKHKDIQAINPTGLCFCGCGETTPMATRYYPEHDVAKGQHFRYIPGHQRRKSPLEYIVDEDSGCWVWQRYICRSGYGRLTVNGKNIRAHRYYYENNVGTIPTGYIIDHLCNNRACVNPSHLEAVTPQENTLRAYARKREGFMIKKYSEAEKRYKEWRTAVFDRDEYKCVLCDNKEGKALHAHHKKSWTDYPELRYDVSNGMTVCENCHKRLHPRKCRK